MLATPLKDDEIKRLIEEAKAIPFGLRPLPAMPERNQHRRKDYEITAESGNSFVICLRQSTMNTFDFSVILGYKVPGVNTIFRLRRYNGKSHYHTNTIERETFRDFHIHTATERYQQCGAKEDHFAVADRRYSDLNSAVDCMLADCGFRSPIEESPLFTGKIV
jgi:hypothetical protein